MIIIRVTSQLFAINNINYNWLLETAFAGVGKVIHASFLRFVLKRNNYEGFSLEIVAHTLTPHVSKWYPVVLTSVFQKDQHAFL